MARIVKVEAYDDKAKEKSEEVTLRLALRQRGSSVQLEVVSPSGEAVFGGILLTITKEGAFVRAGGVSSSFGLKLDTARRVVID